ncbi:23S rRNA (pseudouridine(1915)-N(3))-methyltransferase RlmH [Campylobacter sp. MIT 21-1685]|uniref:23S rRNA (pseudouridine(1915)-N(3))-methyltransferase RlmH n=1 Tax=unclassified Campylobacter TaxID=2593542 RepID=UPI00224A7F93|nr:MULTISPECIES: 23S rRNA (pseudouridine(1915)-N(3))-methyltransferase RlmH [unclassified Campylobacter]MCX2682699.1 23S rRNA (pseudouridine(1915)-N(3))-methyltransferase RlmH [Campylobacter sp. MIT 21-1684]MCX2750979.1 23S rRNA (pseudouridine(1915)-N(3))-methyltransferase RlmH [Campylobacter sp. MIT 21-1682]MCX2807088.1 23S rRNA (pseudouridine(1915)-N(3))-methyltransferase RlmH [Campylobacter sp. MIT 21-1685]
MQIHIFSIQKHKEFESLAEKYRKYISFFATLKEHNLFDRKIANAQNRNALAAKKSYEEVFTPHKKGFCVVLDEKGKAFDSKEFADFIENKNELRFFIGGAYGLREEFCQSFNFSLSLSKLTLAHHFVKILLLEQIYRAFCIKSNHPYHK